MSLYNVVATTNQSTVVSEYTPEGKRSDSYQSEKQLEDEFIRLLTTLGYEYLTIHDEQGLIQNLRKQLEILNDYTFSDDEWDRFFNNNIASSKEGIVEKTRKIQTDHIQNLRRDNGSTMNIRLLDKKNIHNNRLQVINQYETSDGTHDNRYDITVLINGLPLVHIELKRRGVTIREAFNQINRYQRESFWVGSGLFEYVQIFVISNGTHTKYYSNTTREAHIKETESKGRASSKKTSNSFEFTSYWADSNNKIIPDLVDFTKTFFSKHTLLNILTRYCVFTSENLLLVMRPYQISACESIMNRIEISNNYKKYGTIDAGGYIWHTTGSGKTLTSFKTAQLACDLPYIDKVLFVVDRKDLDYQTMKEYDRFEKGAANSNTSTSVLQKQLEDSDSKIIITTIQKLGVFISKNKGHEVYQKRIVIIFDECHRSQFGEMHDRIIKSFKKYHIFGFTGTPIFAENASSGNKPTMRTTPQIFGEKLHTYTIVDAINDNNVLPFRIDYVGKVKEKDIIDIQVKDIDREKAMASPQRIHSIVEYILEHFNQKTKRQSTDKTYSFNRLTNISNVATAKDKGGVSEIKQKERLLGFNSIFAVSSIPVAKAYYNEFQKQMAQRPELSLKIGLIYSFGVNEDENNDGYILEDENPEDTSGLDKSSRDFLDKAISDYNKMFNTNYDTSSDKFQNYYKDVSLRMKNRELDLLIVVNMFLTGFDATTLNTLWVDKNLKYHGLLQAFSRTNRILNSVKAYGNIVCFRDLQTAAEEAIALFGNKEASGIVLLKNYEDYYNGYADEKGHHEGYVELIARLREEFPLGVEIMGEKAQKEFIKLFSSILRVRNILSAFDQFIGDNQITDRDLQDYQSIYIDLYDEIRPKVNSDKENINDDIEFEMELIRQVEINIDYILMLVAKYHGSSCKDKEILIDITKAIASSPELRSKKELIEQFVANININTAVYEDWKKFVEQQKEFDLKNIIEEEQLKEKEARKFIENSFKDGILKTYGTDIDSILPPVRLFGSPENNRQKKKRSVAEKLLKFFEKYFGL